MSTSKEQRLEHLFEDYHRQVYAYCRRRADEETAREAASETFLIAWRKIDLVPDGASTLPWLYAVARRVLANRFRGRKRRRNLITRLGGLGTLPEPGPDDLVTRRSERLEVLEALGRLRAKDQELLRLAVWEELPHARIGEILGCSAHAVDQRIRRAEDRLASEMRRPGHSSLMKATPNPLSGDDGT